MSVLAREAKEIGLREMAKMIGVSPAYLSKVERNEFAPLAEDKVKAIAQITSATRRNWRRYFGLQRD